MEETASLEIFIYFLYQFWPKSDSNPNPYSKINPKPNFNSNPNLNL